MEIFVAKDPVSKKLCGTQQATASSRTFAPYLFQKTLQPSLRLEEDV